ncbi:MAG: hypothetical protein Q8K18_09285 [Burkholderiales bacterium]|nr:hypothetical protein [Burkholderiales bacterium]
MNAEDLKALQFPLIVLLCVALLGAGAIYYSDALLDQSQKKLVQEQKQLKEARTRLQRSGSEKEVIVQYLGGYQQLERSGFAGEEKRINWLDGLRLANQQAELFGADYQISTQKPYPYAAEFNPAPLKLVESEMKLRLRLLHSEDLMRFFNALARQNAGLFLINACKMNRIETGGVIRVQPNVMAECELSWVTAQPGATTEKKP